MRITIMTEKINDKKTAIFAATLQLISQQGLHATPMSQIADKAKIGMGTIYHYFPSKESLINALYLENKAKLLSFLMLSYDADCAIEQSFKTLMRSMITYYSQNPADLYFIEQCENSPIITESTKEDGLRSAGVLIELFCRAKVENLIKEIPFEILGALIGGSMISLAKLCLSDGVKIDSNAFDVALDAMWDMLKR